MSSYTFLSWRPFRHNLPLAKSQGCWVVVGSSDNLSDILLFVPRPQAVTIFFSVVWLTS